MSGRTAADGIILMAKGYLATMVISIQMVIKMHFYRVLLISLISFFLFGCATYKDFGSSFIVTGEVECRENCNLDSAVTVQLLDTGLDYKRKHHRFVMASQLVNFHQHFQIETTYLWAYKQTMGTAPMKRIVTVEVVSRNCVTNTKEIDLKDIKRENGKYLLEVGILHMECKASPDEVKLNPGS